MTMKNTRHAAPSELARLTDGGGRTADELAVAALLAKVPPVTPDDVAAERVWRRVVAKDVKHIFDEIEATGYPITKVVPIVAYKWDDQASIDDNNTSAFNYRHVIGPGQNSAKLSNHSFGRAIDLNPGINPFVAKDGTSPRPYDPSKPGTLTLKSPVTQIFLTHNWKWGGQWMKGKDYQHFERVGGRG